MPDLSQEPRILILGATSAIAMAVARAFVPRRPHFFLVARSTDKLETVRLDLLTRGATAVQVRALDLDQIDAHVPMLEEALATLGSLDAALIAHGVLGDQQKAQTEFVAAWSILQTNFISAASLITWLANYFEAQKRGTLAVIGSVAGDRGRKSNYVYGASKGALEIFLAGVRNRIDRFGVHVLTIKPGLVATPMTAQICKGPLFASPEKVARGIVRAIDRRKNVVYVPAFWALILFVIRSIPERIFKRLDL
jgi:decaprenylphospho-beta-D-erythro-pentofuranosid-2-ulose 2-reductase